MTLDELHNWFFTEFGLCGCGDPAGVVRLIKEVLALSDKRSKAWAVNDDETARGVYKVQQAILAYPSHSSLYWHFLYWLDHLGLTEHGTNISGAWLTDKGQEVLALLESVEDLERWVEKGGDE